MDKSDSHRRKKFRVPKPDSNVSTSHKWTIFVIFLSFVLSLVFSLITSVAMQSLNLFFAFIVLFAIIAINILFDMIGTAVQSAEEKPFQGWLHSLTIPRELFVQNGKLHQQPVKELESIRRHERVIEAEGHTFINQETWSAELLAEQISDQKFSFNFGNVLKISFANNSMVIQRKHWSSEEYDEVRAEISVIKNIRVFLDQSTAEIFVNNGEKVFTFKSFFTDDKWVEVESEKTIRIKIWRMEA